SNPSPANNALAVTPPTLLSWWGAADASSYDVYFGTSATPPFTATVTAATYNPGALSAGTTYYWRIVAKSSSGSASSSIWSFTTAASPISGPASVSVNPSSGSGLYHVFSFVFSDSTGYQNLSAVSMLVSASSSPVNACWVYYDVVGKELR